jgi:hypothetical protein
MIFEPILLVLSILVLCLFNIGKQAWDRRRRRRRGLALESRMAELAGQKAWEAEKWWGPPTEVAEGSRGRRLYIWKRERMAGIPEALGLIVVTLTVDAENVVEGTHFELRGGE